MSQSASRNQRPQVVPTSRRGAGFEEVIYKSQGADDIAGHCHSRIRFDAGQTEIGDPELARTIQKHVARFHVSVNDALIVRGVQRLGSLNA